ncbi:BgTH12-00392 [Blumeria graminis f. sp. triticale]|uniref:Conserved oligomeric Golgi complex subunit 5 n=3 Tax=Blumeria graminis TaxID=34373 RepID=A0A061HIZ4_BLUGR|nr:hypothetical protein BGT96224_3238 [Blumeria graminis f. sp. tritici 96224]CAD6504891.1 BgTH12-00392 [Blumeria graminis f. sp. triticale]VDB92911.1 Bgt-3238 [Blumeria graminis f. sp. tritici]
MTEDDTCYIDYETFLTPSFSPAGFANSLVLGTNNPTDVPLDLSTPLSKVLFDIQEINTTIDNLSTQLAVPLLTHVQSQITSSERIGQEIEFQVASLTDSYNRLEKDVLIRYETAEEVRSVAERLWETARLGRSVGRFLQLGRQLEIQVSEIAGTGNTEKPQGQREDHAALIRCSNTLLGLRELLLNKEGEEGYGLERVDVVKTFQISVLIPAERLALAKSRQVIQDFSVNSYSSTYSQTTDIKAKTTSALTTLFLLSPFQNSESFDKWVPEYLVNSINDYLRASFSSSLASLNRALTSLPILDRTLLEISVRSQNIVFLESILMKTPKPAHLIFSTTTDPSQNLLQPVLACLEIKSLTSWFWRTLAEGLTTKVIELVNKGGVSVRNLRNNKNSIRDAIKDCVIRGVQLVGTTEKIPESKWEREVAVMVGSLMGPLGK